MDLRKACDNVWQEGLFKKLEDDKAPRKLIDLVRMWCRTVKARVRVREWSQSGLRPELG